MVWDVVVRHLRARGFQVKYVRNFTDVDDKIIKRANERGEDPVALAARFADAFHQDMDALGCLRPDVEPRVSDHIPEIVALIETLVEKGFAYAPGNGDVYFAVRRFPEYGKLSGRNLDDLLAGARVEPGEVKRDPLDFALWKGAKPGEPRWPSPWGEGRPGWHIECSAMTRKHLGDTFDLHTGGKDLVFPHHTNEIAQSVCACGDGEHADTYARDWMHNGFVEIDDEKMSKSLGNFFTVRAGAGALRRRGAAALPARHPLPARLQLLRRGPRRGRAAARLPLRDAGEGRPAGGRGGAGGRARRRWWSAAGPRWTTTSTPPRCWGCWPRPSPPPTRCAT